MDFRTFEQRNELPSSHPQVGTYLTSGFQMACPHWHPHYELTIIHKPISYEIMNNSNTIRGNRPVISIHRPYTVHMVRTGDGEYLRSIVRFDSQFISGFPAGIVDLSKIAESDFACAYPDDDELEEFIDMTRKITSFLKEKKDTASAKLRVAELLHRIILIIDSGRGERFSGGITYIQETLRIIGENLSEPMTIAALCEKFDIGESKFCADFKSHTGKTYKKYLTDLRMTRAYELLQSGSSIINASLETGYSSEAHFIAAFRRYWGKTPGSFAPVKK